MCQMLLKTVSTNKSTWWRWKLDLLPQEWCLYWKLCSSVEGSWVFLQLLIGKTFAVQSVRCLIYANFQWVLGTSRLIMVYLLRGPDPSHHRWVILLRLYSLMWEGSSQEEATVGRLLGGSAASPSLSCFKNFLAWGNGAFWSVKNN